MPKIAKEMTALAVSKLRAPGKYSVGGCPGLMLRVTGSSRAWVLRIQVGDTRRDYGLGSYPLVPLAEAREKGREYHRMLLRGEIPATPKSMLLRQSAAPQESAITFRQCANELIANKQHEWRNPKHRQQWVNSLEAYAFPVLGDMPAADIQMEDVLRVLQPIWLTRNETASRLRGRVEAVLDYAIALKRRTAENPARWKGGLAAILPAPTKVQKTRHHPAMAIDQVPGFIAQVRGKNTFAAAALVFLIHTAARSGEVRGAQWSEVDLQSAVWVVPAGRMKAGAEHRVPLSRQALGLLQTLPRLDGSPFIFPAPRGGQLSDMTMLALMRRMGHGDFVPHGFRSTFRDWAGDRTNFPRDLAEQALAHTLTNKAEAAYRRSDALERRRALMQTWSDFLEPEQ